jgi:hypothetical protein
LWFGGAKKLEDLDIKELRDEKSRLQVEMDRLSNRMTAAEDERDALFNAAAEPGVSTAQKQIAAYKMDQAGKVGTKAESDLQETLGRLNSLNAIMDLLDAREELTRKGIWKTLNEMGEEQLSAQITEASVQLGGGRNTVSLITEMLEKDSISVAGSRSGGVNRSLQAIEEEAARRASRD